MLPLLILLLLLLLLHNLITRNGITAVCVDKSRDADTHIRTSARGGGGMPPFTI